MNIIADVGGGTDMKYFVSYVMQYGNKSNGYGDAVISRPTKIQSYEDISEIKETIRKDINAESVVILWYKLLT